MASVASSPSAEAEDCDSQVANIIFAVESQMDVVVPADWESHLQTPIDESRLDVQSRVQKAKDRLGNNRDELPIEVRTEGSTRTLFLPTNFYESPHDLKRIIAICANRLKFEVKLERSNITLEDPENEILLGILFGLSDKGFAKIKPDTKSQFEIGRNICNWERRLAYCYAKGLDPNCLHLASKYAGDGKQVKLLTKVLRDCAPRTLGNEKRKVWEACVNHIEALIKCYFRDLMKYQKPDWAAPIDIFKSFDETWSAHAITRRIETTTNRKVKGRDKKVTTTRVVRYHPKKPSSLVGILDSEQELVKATFDTPWHDVNEIKSNWTELLKHNKWEKVNSQLKQLSEQQSWFYNFVRKSVNSRIRQYGNSIPSREDFRKWLNGHDTKEKRGKITTSYFSPLVLLDEKLYLKFASTVIPAPTFTNAALGKFDNIVGFSIAFEWYIKFFELENQAKVLRDKDNQQKESEDQSKISLTNQFSELSVDDVPTEDRIESLLGSPAERAKARAEKREALSFHSLSSIGKPKQKKLKGNPKK